jgi:hypothetical protein
LFQDASNHSGTVCFCHFNQYCGKLLIYVGDEDT